MDNNAEPSLEPRKIVNLNEYRQQRLPATPDTDGLDTRWIGRVTRPLTGRAVAHRARMLAHLTARTRSTSVG
jgi:hypothetical protein